jgi:oligopeptide/dipeptide ABC transporter ATP-binding protein
MEALLEVKNLSIGIRRGGELLSSVEDVSFDIYPGEILGIVGESGSGKTLTALSIPSLLGENKEITSGSILYNGMDLAALPEKKMEAIRGKEISMVFQEPYSSLNPLIKIGAQIGEGLTLHADFQSADLRSGEKDKALVKNRAKELMKRLGLPDTYPHRLSGGMCQRAMIAIAIICGPRLLIADEPTTALDHDTQSKILTLLKEINRESGTSILFISHDIEVIKELCGRVLVMYSGRILEEGNTDEIFSNPAHEYTRGLLSSVPSAAIRGKALAAIPGKIPSLEEGRPSGCPFHPRCAKTAPECKGDFPPARKISVKHTTRCVFGGAE